MKTYRITVNGNVYDVQVEEVNGSAVPMTAPVAPAPVAPAPVAAPVATTPAPVAAAPAPAASAPAPAPTGSGEGVKITSPMPGTILDIKVNVGDRVEENQVVIILEAMKMENEIVTSVGGSVTGINVTKGQTVASGDVLVTVAQ